jgi:3-deoxy-D-manno-octulosonate 8-phosphate phosphatase (KDO 8-P phosphatase)
VNLRCDPTSSDWPAARALLGRVKLIALDVDGVLTDGTFLWGPGGQEFKRLSFLDIMGLSIGRRAGLRFALVSGEASELVDRLATKMTIPDVFKGCKDKAAAARELIERHHLSGGESCFMGDDINDVPAMTVLGLGVAPPGAHLSALSAAALVTTRPGGNGAVRDLVDAVLLASKPSHDAKT